MVLAAAQEKLKTNRATLEATNLAEKGAGFGAAVEVLNSAAFDAGLGNVKKTEAGETPKVYRDFEAVFLQNFVKSMMPDDSEAVYGKGNAGEIWKSMMAEQIGGTIAESGGVGIADQMYSEELARKRGGNTVNAATNETDRRVALNMVTDLERRTLGVSTTDGQTT
ncbi:hypothetical protein GCM10007920_42290 [Ciceribacter naphthalenivorans]|uniref:Flagellar protein FlgJ N-terminal domain-containing protein n=3 Tax=Pseudomonadota TaxID=1224 RepID=A0A512HIF1_9HYPH|nr:hypothetical protein RNA01_21630 [Ciceribacter naphthalenivorans]GLR24435.1 hypothetical protein GCM10007920_42290 [Ciceribacter naphthalenivorans]GLT07291.1 hypothetical protein GCM10007926_42290 [Sphingomonas psychrolutea]